MKNYGNYLAKCQGARPEVNYRGTIVYYPTPQVAIVLSELTHDTGLTGSKLVDKLVMFALEHVAVRETKAYELVFNEEVTT